MKKGITILEVIVAFVIVSTSIILLISMMFVYNKSYQLTEQYNESLNEILRTKEILDLFMERNRNKQFKYNNDNLYVEEELALEFLNDKIIDHQTKNIISLTDKKIVMKVLNNNLLCFQVEVDNIKQDYMYFIGGFIIDS